MSYFLAVSGAALWVFAGLRIAIDSTRYRWGLRIVSYVAVAYCLATAVLFFWSLFWD